jgi:DinB family protein
MANSVPQNQLRAALLDANSAAIARIRGAVSAVPPETMVRPPPTGGWSIAEVLEHLIVSADSYLETLRPLVQRKDGARVDGVGTWKPTLMGGLLAASLRNKRKLPAPAIYKPGPNPRPRVLEEFLRRQEEVGRLLTDAGDMDWRRVRLRSPVLHWLPMNLGDALTVLVVHAERHAAQIERVKASHSSGSHPSAMRDT